MNASSKSMRRGRVCSSVPIFIERLESRALLAGVPLGFTDSVIAANLTGPDALDVAGDGRVFFTDQSGHVRIIQNDQLLSTPFADLSASVDSSGERGLLGIALDPNFASNRYVYVYYTASAPISHNRLSRLTASASNPNVMQAGSEVVLFDFPSIGTAIWHMGGSIQFGPDEKLYISVGDNQQPAESQSLNSVFGKILRVNTDGTIPTDNPFYSQLVGINRAIWALGLRNPYTTAFQPETGRFFLNDVGQDTWEEINNAFAGANFGWPGTEGDFDQAAFPTYSRPLYTYQHTSSRVAITGGAFYNPEIAQFPSEYTGKYFFLDFGSGEIWTLDPSTRAATLFGTGSIFSNGMDVGPEGNLYYLTRGAGANGQPSVGTGAVHKIQYTVNSPPSIMQQPQPRLVSVGQSVTFSVSASGSSPLSYQWTRNGSTIAGATGSTYTIASATLANNGAVYRVRVSNAVDSILSSPATLSVTTNAPPAGVINILPSSATYRGGDTIQFSGTASDTEDGTLPTSAMTWRVDFHHHEHLHPFVAPFSGAAGGSFTIPTTGETASDVWYRIHLTITDSTGLQTDVYRDVLPITANLSVSSNVPGLQFKLDGQPKILPYTTEGVAGIQRTIDVPSPQVFNGQTYVFTGWSDGGAASRTITFPQSDTTVTANFSPLASVVTFVSDLPYVGTPINGWGAAEKDRSNGEVGPADGRGIILNGQPYSKGLGVHANSDLQFNLEKKYTQFQAEIGLDDEVGNNGSVIFQVYVDGLLAYTSPTMTGASATIPVTVPITGASTLRLVVNEAGNGNVYDHADWANARLSSGAAPVTPPPTTLLGPPVSYPTGSQAHGVTAADVNGDGKLDLAVANAGASTVSVLIGVGDGTFLPAVSYPVGSTPKAVAAKDLNGDGKLDLVTANQGAGTVSVLINTGNGTYLPKVDYTGTSGAHEVALADVDGDNDNDIIEAGWGASQVRVIFNNGNGIFSNGTNYTIGAAPHSVVAVDLTGDGKPDLAIADHDSANVAVLVNNGNGTFKPATFFGVGSGPHSLRAGDFDGDQKLDLITANEFSNNASVLIGNGDGTFKPAVNYATGLVPKGIAIGDINGDGKPDILSANTAGNYPNSDNPGGDQVAVLLNNGNGTFGSATLYTTGRTPFSITVGDFDGDGDQDVASANWHTNDVTVLKNLSGTRTNPPGNTPPVTTVDSATTPVNQPVQINVLGNDSDPGGSIDPSTVGITTQPAHGSVTINLTTGIITYTPAANYSGADEFFYTVADNQGAISASTRVSLTVVATTPPSGTVYLSDLTPTSSTNGWGTFEKDRSNGEAGAADGRAITLAGQTYAKGLGVHAASDLRYVLGGAYEEFRAEIGVDDEVGNSGSVVFQVYVDNVLKYTSPTMTGGSATLAIVVPVTGAAALRLVVTDAGNGNAFDHADWAAARLTAASGSTPLSPAAPQALGADASGNQVSLNWTDASNNEVGFRVERKTGTGGTWSQIADLTAGTQGYTDPGLVAGNTYFYRVYAYGAGGNSGYSNEASAAVPIIQPPPGTTSYLSDLAYTVVSNGWGAAEKDRSNGESGANDGRTISIRGTTYAKGIGAHANSDLRFNLRGQYNTFATSMGIDDETAGRGSVVFQIYVDGVLKYDSGTTRGTDAVKTASVSVAGGSELRLVITNNADGSDFDHADWALARLST